jgi:hypothetical protein
MQWIVSECMYSAISGFIACSLEGLWSYLVEASGTPDELDSRAYMYVVAEWFSSA